MNDKLFELITKIYSEMQDMKANMASKNDIQGINESIKELDDKVTKVDSNIIRIENELKDNIEALYDGYKVSIESINELRNDIKQLKEKVDNHEVKLKVVK